MVNTRSSDGMEASIAFSKVEELIQPLQDTITKLEKLLDENKNEFTKQLEKHSSEIFNLQVRIQSLENQSIFTHHLIHLHQRKLDDQEQYSRKPNVIIEGIEVKSNETPNEIMEYIKERVNDLDVEIKDFDFDRCHRIGPKYVKENGRTYQRVILRMCSWRSRNIIYVNRKRLPFFVVAD